MDPPSRVINDAHIDWRQELRSCRAELVEAVPACDGSSDMTDRSLVLEGSRTLVISAVGAPLSSAVQPPFATLLPAYNAEERERAVLATTALMRAGCVDFCCVGPEADLLEDAIDEIVEDAGELDVVTVACEDATEAIEYFLLAAAGGSGGLLALIEEHPELQQTLWSEHATSRRRLPGA